jgi:hypothetical protein
LYFPFLCSRALAAKAANASTAARASVVRIFLRVFALFVPSYFPVVFFVVTSSLLDEAHFFTKISIIVTVDEPVFLKPCFVPPLTNWACHAVMCTGFSDSDSNCMPAAIGMKR